MSILAVIIVISALIFFHELGHFLIARYFGVKVEVFSVGFGYTLISKKYKDTMYALKAIPLGGYVKLKGQDDTNPTGKSDDEDSYTQKTPYQKIGILFAGPLANIILAFTLYFVVGLTGHNVLSPIIGSLEDNMPAQRAGLKVNDRIIKINYTDIKSWGDISEAIQRSKSHIVKVTVLRDGIQIEINVASEVMERENIFREKINVKIIGISPKESFEIVKYNLFQSIAYSINQTIEASTLIIKSIQKLITGIIPAKEVGGVISIVQITVQAANIGLTALLLFTALISINLAILNLLPIPALDGGHIMFNIYEIITRKEPTEKIVYALTIGGWIILAMLMTLGLYNDINRIFE